MYLVRRLRKVTYQISNPHLKWRNERSIMKLPFSSTLFSNIILVVAALLLDGLPVSAQATFLDNNSVRSYVAETTGQWELITLPTEVSSNQVFDLAVHPVNAYTAFLATSNGLYKTIDAGHAWVRISASTFMYGISQIHIAPSDPQRLYAIATNFYRSENGGDSWTTLTLPASTCDIRIAPLNANRLYARVCSDGNPSVLRSDDAGQSWVTPSPTFTQMIYGLEVSPINPDLIIATTYNEVLRSSDGGATWVNVPMYGHTYFQMAFDSRPPYTLYMGHQSGLLRSTDGGQTFQDSFIKRGFSYIFPLPFDVTEMFGQGGGSAERGPVYITSVGNTWRAATWIVPTPLLWLKRSVSDSRVLYAKTETGLWRYTVSLPYSNQVFLPLILSSLSSPAEQALVRVNQYRALVGVAPLQLHPSLVAAANNHANYYKLNHADPLAWNGVMPSRYHSEMRSKPGFTGVWPAERAYAAGYPEGWGTGENIHFIGDPIAAVDGWMATIFHRASLIAAENGHVGYGYGDSNLDLNMDVMEFGTGPANEGFWYPAEPFPVAYPADGQTNVPLLWNGAEYPDPLPPGAPRPVGYPFTLSGAPGYVDNVDLAEMRDDSGQTVEVYVNTYPPFALIPVRPLKPNTTYTIHVRGKVGWPPDVAPFDRVWHFTTGG